MKLKTHHVIKFSGYFFLLIAMYSAFLNEAKKNSIVINPF